MAKTRIQDVIVPEVFANYVSSRTAELSAIMASGIAVSNPLLDELISRGGRTVNMPFWKALSGSDEVLSDATPLTPEKISAGKDVAAVLLRAKSWGANDLAGALAGSDPMASVAEQVAEWWNAREQDILISELTGVFNGPLKTTHVKDIAALTGSAAVISADAVLDTKQLLGDAASKLTAIIMHSAVYTLLQKQNLIEYIPASDSAANFSTYLGYRVIVDDKVPVSAGVYYTYLFADGAFGRGEGQPAGFVPAETDRDSLQSDDYLINRRALVLHPFGVKWLGASVAGSSPTNAELAMPANWEKVFDDKQIGMAALKHKIA